MTMPTAVKAQMQAAEDAQKRLSRNPDAIAPAQEAPTEQPKQPKQEQQPVKTADDQALTPGAKEQDTAYWKGRFDVLQGKYNKEVPQLSQDNSQLRKQVEELSKKPEIEQTYLSAEEREEYGDVGTMMERIAKQAAKDATKPFEEVTTETRQSLYFRDLDSLSTGWREKNTDDGFNEWLDEYDQLSGVPRRELLTKAHTSGQAERTAAIFNAYSLVTKQADATKPIDEQPVYPDTTNNGGTPPNTGPRPYTRAEISKFYKDKAHGVYDGREDEASAIEREIFASQ